MLYFEVVGPAGLEPATLCLEGRCSIHLSYGPVHSNECSAGLRRRGEVAVLLEQEIGHENWNGNVRKTASSILATCAFFYSSAGTSGYWVYGQRLRITFCSV